MSSLLILLLIGAAVFIMYLIVKNSKTIKIGSLALVNGGVKTGKTTMSVYLAIREYKKIHRSWKIQKWFCELLGKKVPEEPLLYSNIPLAVPFVKLTSDILTQKSRVRYKSVVYVDEASFVADNDSYRDKPLDERLKMFNKLYGHSTHGGILIYDTQAIGDVSIQIRRNLANYVYIHHLVKWIPFILIAYVRENVYSEDNSVQNNFNEDLEDSLKRVIIPKSTWKKFDCYCYSIFTDDLPVESAVIDGSKLPNLKSPEILAFDGNNRTKEKFYRHAIKEVPHESKV